MTSTTARMAIPFERQVYEDPFLDMASTMLPKDFRKLLEMCQIFATQHPQVAPVIWRLAEYAITSIVYSGNPEAIRVNREVFDNKLQILDRGLEWGLDYYTYGNCFVYVSLPFLRWYECATCHTRKQARDVNYTLRGGVFEGACTSTSCGGGKRKLIPHDVATKQVEGINILRLEPILVTPKVNRTTGASWYLYDIPADIKDAVNRGDRDIIDSTPISYLQCVFLNVKLKLKKNAVFHFKRPTVSGRDMAWGLPLVMPVLKKVYLNQIFEKSDEMIASEHSVPLRIMYPEPTSQDPLNKISMRSFKQMMDRSIQHWRRDKNAIITAPLPVGVKAIGGDQGAYQTVQQRQFIVDEILGGMLVTKGFVMGGEQWSSASISQRILENSFTNYLRRFDVCLQWVADIIQRDLKLPECKLTMKPFKKVDDVQMQQLVLQLARENKVSWGEALSRLDIDSDEQMKQIEEEFPKHLKILMDQLVAQAEAGARSSMIQAKAQTDVEGAQQLMAQRSAAGQPRQLGPGGEQPVPGPGGEGGESAMVANANGGGAAKGDRSTGEEDDDLESRMSPEARAGTGGGGTGAGQEPGAEGPAPRQGRVRMEDQINTMADQLLTMSEQEQRQMLTQMRDETPELGAAVAQRASERMFAREAQELISNSKNPEEIAQRLSMMPPKRSLALVQIIREQNPHLGMQVLKSLAQLNRSMTMGAGAANGSGGGGQGNGPVDMTPLPEKLPPRRTNSPV